MNYQMHTPASLVRHYGTPKPFRDIDKGAMFECNGNLWCKVSSRTALGFWPACLPNHSFYFGMNEICYQENKGN